MPTMIPTPIRHAARLCVLGAALAGPASAQTSPPPDASGPQSAVPTARPGGTADVPGGTARNGIVQPPPMGGNTPVIKPGMQSNMPVITPPGMAGPQTVVVPK